MTDFRKLAVPLAAAACLVRPPAAHATVGAIFFGVGAISYTVVPPLAGGAALSKDPVTGRILAAGATVVAIGDPLSAVFYNGSFVQTYDPVLLRVERSGWLGSWGADPTLPAPPADTALWPATGVPLNLQAPNAALSATVANDSVAGTQTWRFDWGPGGHAEPSAGAFNFFATVFTLKADAYFTALGDAPNGAPPAGANFYVSTPGIFCSPPNETTVDRCGEQVTSYWRVSMVPEPGTAWLVAAGAAGVAVAARRAARRQTAPTARRR